jgi:hypothetical protein
MRGQRSEDRLNIKFEILSTKHETNPNDQNWSSGLPTLRAGPQFQMTKTGRTKIRSKVFVWDIGELGF